MRTRFVWGFWGMKPGKAWGTYCPTEPGFALSLRETPPEVMKRIRQWIEENTK